MRPYGHPPVEHRHGVSRVDEARPILLVEDNVDDEALTLRAFTKNNIHNPIVVVRDGAEALDWLFRRGAHAGRGLVEPSVVMLDIQHQKVDGLAEVAHTRATTAHIPRS